MLQGHLSWVLILVQLFLTLSVLSVGKESTSLLSTYANLSSLVTSLPICSTSTYPLQQPIPSSHPQLPEFMATFFMLLSSQCFILWGPCDIMGCWITHCNSRAPAAQGSDSAFLKDLVYKSQREKSDKARKRGKHVFKVQDDTKGK